MSAPDAISSDVEVDHLLQQVAEVRARRFAASAACLVPPVPLEKYN
jgi:hypothetical protein